MEEKKYELGGLVECIEFLSRRLAVAEEYIAYINEEYKTKHQQYHTIRRDKERLDQQVFRMDQHIKNLDEKIDLLEADRNVVLQKVLEFQSYYQGNGKRNDKKGKAAPKPLTITSDGKTILPDV